MAVAFDEMNGPTGIRPAYDKLAQWLGETPPEALQYRREEAELLFRRIGITFAVYGDNESTERLIPFDVIPRVLSAKEWGHLEKGLKQRVKALNMFLSDIYHARDILRAGIIPDDLIFQNPVFRPEMNGQDVPHDIYVHVAGIDVIRTDDNDFIVLEDNARTPSGVSYMLENRETLMQMFPELFQLNKVQRVEDYPYLLRQSLASLAPPGCKGKPRVAVLTPGIYNSAYYEHSFLADTMGVELVEGSDLRVIDGKVKMRTTRGYEAIDVLYRRVDDDFLDPLTFRPDSALGIPGIMDVYRSGNITIANAPGTGICDDKAIYSYMPEIVEFYTGRKSILENVPTWRCSEPSSLKYVLEHIEELVIKEVHGSGGYGMLVGPTASKKERADFAEKLKARPNNYIAQPTLSLSTVPILVNKGIAPRHVDLRPYVLVSDKVQIIPGGLTRVALKQGSLVVNSSQGGGTKDTWVLED